MSIGETLAEARRQAGLTVPQLSQQTRIRETIIRGIEQDDYSACGGDFYARGHIRAMARAIGADPVSLIQEYDESTGALGGLGPGAGAYGAEDYGNVRVSPAPGGPGQAGHAPSVFDPAPPPTQARPTFQASPPPSAPSVFAPTHGPPASRPDPAYPAPSVYHAVDQVPRDPGEAGADTYRLPRETDDDVYRLPRETGDDAYQPPHETGDDAYQLPYETGDDTYQPPRETGDGTYQPPHETGDGTYQPPHETGDGTYRLPPYETGADAGPALAPQPLRREPRPAPPPVTRGASWISSVFDSAPEDPAEITEPNAIRPAIRVAGSKPPRRENRLAIFAVATLVVVGLLAYLLANVFSSNSPAKPSAGATASQGTHPKTGGASSHPSATPSQTPSSAPPAAPAPVALKPAGADAFGPSGAGQGDNPQEAGQAIDRSSSTGWASDWYSTSHFGNLQAGTGLLLNMGRTVTISSAKITLASTPGADLQLRVGSSPSLAALKPIAHANNAGGVVRLQVPKAVTARYVLVWFTNLPQDAAGTYQVKVYNIALKGNG